MVVGRQSSTCVDGRKKKRANQSENRVVMRELTIDASRGEKHADICRLIVGRYTLLSSLSLTYLLRMLTNR